MNNEKKKQIDGMVQVIDQRITLSDVQSMAVDDKRLRYFEKKYQGVLYQEILLLLTHRSFPSKRAKRLWFDIVDHYKLLNSRVGRDVGIVVATLDYLSNVNKVLQAPLLIEEEMSQYIAHSSTTDELTGLFVRDVFEIEIIDHHEDLKIDKQAFCLAIIDIDDFKLVNDTHGHVAGDEVLSEMGKTIISSVRDSDIVARYGGEEIVVIMPKTTKQRAFDIVERIRSNVEELKFDQFSITISSGIYEATAEDTVKEIVKKADKALYEAKRTGKNVTVIFNE